MSNVERVDLIAAAVGISRQRQASDRSVACVAYHSSRNRHWLCHAVGGASPIWRTHLELRCCSSAF